MSDDERDYSEEEEVEEVDKKRSQRNRSEISDSGKMTETEMAIEEKLRKKKEEEEAMWSEYIEQRKKQRQKEEEELKKLKERQAKRKTQRAEQEKLMFEMKRKQEEQKQREIEEKKQREQEAKRKRLEEAEKKRQAMMQAMQKQKEEVKPNFVINKKEGAPGLPSAGGFGKSDLNKTKEQLAEEKKIAMGIRIKPLDIEGCDKDELKKKAQDLWEQIVQLESEKYDLEERQKRQDYDLKELNERQRQINRNKALKKGLDPEALSGKYPPKIQTASKYERRVDRRTYVDKKTLFEGGLIEAYKVTTEKTWEDRNTEYKERGGVKLPKWDPTNPKNKESYEPGARMIDDDTDDIDLMDQLKQQYISMQDEPAPKPAPPPPSSKVQEEEEEEEYEEEEEEEEEE